jgi:predicted regulator of Ras-like GTPase activity (Roadblock/LC7/MglB family)/DNA-binding Xre family transcriptional regulator
MNNDPYAVALKNALTEIKNICPDVRRSFIFAKDRVIATGDPETDEETMKKTIDSFQSVAEKADSIGSLKAFYVNGNKGKIILSSVNDMYLALAASEDADTTYLHSVTRVIIPTVLKLLETITSTPPASPTPLQSAPSKQLVVDTLSGFFVGDSVQIDTELLEEWAELSNQKGISEVEIESFGGEATQCKVREINDSKLKGKGMIRIPEKVCKTLEVKKGELVKVKPAST